MTVLLNPSNDLARQGCPFDASSKFMSRVIYDEICHRTNATAAAYDRLLSCVSGAGNVMDAAIEQCSRKGAL